MPGYRPDRVADQIRAEISTMLAREVHDPGIGFLTITRVQVSPDLQVARVFYTALGTDLQRRATAKALLRAAPFLRRQVGQRLRLRRVPTLEFVFDKSIETQDRVERLIQEIHEADAAHASETHDPDAPSEPEPDDD
jgi:ribosome-binding factor A